MPSNFKLGLDWQVSQHHATVGGMVISLSSVENRLQAQISNFVKQVTKTISLEDFFFAVSPWEANFCCFSPRQVKLYWFIRSLQIWVKLFFRTIERQFTHDVVISTSISPYIVYVNWLNLAAETSLLSAHGDGSCDISAQQIYLLGQLSRIYDMITDHLKLLGCEVLLLQLQPIPQFS